MPMSNVAKVNVLPLVTDCDAVSDPVASKRVFDVSTRA